MNTSQYALMRIVNLSKSGEGTGLPPRFVGGTRVPIVSNVQLVRAYNDGVNNVLVISWEEPDSDQDMISHYQVYVSGVDGYLAFQGPFSTVRPPAVVRISSDVTGRARVVVQTVMKNGQMSDLGASPVISIPILRSRNLRNDFVTVSSSQTLPVVSNVLANAAGGSITLTLPYSGLNQGAEIRIRRIDSSGNTCSIAPASGDTINMSATPLNLGVNQVARLVSDGTTWWTM